MLQTELRPSSESDLRQHSTKACPELTEVKPIDDVVGVDIKVRQIIRIPELCAKSAFEEAEIQTVDVRIAVDVAGEAKQTLGAPDDVVAADQAVAVAVHAMAR